MGKYKDITGKKFDKWTVVSYAYTKRYNTSYIAYWNCKCDCGNECVVNGNHLRMGKSKQCKSCGNSRPGDKNPQYGIRGKDNCSWNPNITDEERELRRTNSRAYPEYQQWRKAVYEIDNYTCKKCGSNKGGTLIAHHIESYAKNKNLRLVVSNGITLCIDCHKSFHHKYGQITNKKQFEEFMK